MAKSEIEVLRDEVARLRKEVDAMREPGRHEPTSSRRQLIKSALGAAVGGGAVLLAGAKPAAAANGDPLIWGFNQGTAGLVFQKTTNEFANAEPLMEVENQGLGESIRAGNYNTQNNAPTIRAHAFGAGHGILVSSYNQAGTVETFSDEYVADSPAQIVADSPDRTAIRASTNDGRGVDARSKNGVGVYGRSVNANGVYGERGVSGVNAGPWAGVRGDAAGEAVGVVGTSNSWGVLGAGDSAGVVGIVRDTGSPQGAGVYGIHDGTGAGVVGISAAGASVRAAAENSLDGGRLRIDPRLRAMPPTQGFGVAGDMVRDSAGALWLCVNDSGLPSAWRRVPMAQPGYVPGSGSVGSSGIVHLFPKPFRLYDSRSPEQGGVGGTAGILGGDGKIAPQTARSIQVTGTVPNATPVGVPSGAVAIIGVITLTQTEGSTGYLVMYPGQTVEDVPPTSNVNWFGTNQNIAASYTTAIGSTGVLRVRNGSSFNATHCIVDVGGFIA